MTERRAPEPVEPPAAAPEPTPVEPVDLPPALLEPALPHTPAVPVLRADQPTASYQLIGEAPAEPPASPAHGLAGDVAVDVARQLAEPVQALRDRLGLVVDHLERHVADATGPTPYPWRSLQTLRQDLAAAYLEATTLARRLDELDRALEDDPPGWFDVAAAVELGIHLAGHHLSAGIELLIDLGHTPPARGIPGHLALVVAQLVALSVRSARDLPGSTVSVRVMPEPPWVLVAIADNGAGSPRAAALGDLARSVIAPWDGTVDAASVPGAGCTFELRLATTP